MEALRGVELTSTNWPCGLIILSKANIEVDARSPGDEPRYVATERRARVVPTRDAREAFGKRPTDSGGDVEEAIPDPISNSEVKLLRADGTAREIRVGE